MDHMKGIIQIQQSSYKNNCCFLSDTIKIYGWILKVKKLHIILKSERFWQPLRTIWI